MSVTVLMTNSRIYTYPSLVVAEMGIEHLVSESEEPLDVVEAIDDDGQKWVCEWIPNLIPERYSDEHD